MSSASAAREFLHIGQLIPPAQEILSVPPAESVGATLSRMREHDYDQIPVMAADRVLGIFTWRSFARNMQTNSAVYPDALTSSVLDWVEDLKYVRPRDGLGEVLPHLNRDGAVLVGDEDRLRAIVTLADLSDFLWRTTEPFVLIQDIELAIRDLMVMACPGPDVMTARIQAAGLRGSGSAAAPEDLTFGQLLRVLMVPESYTDYFSSTFGLNPQLVEGQLEPVRLVRNRVFHFSGDLVREEYEALISARRWLQRKVDAMADGVA